MANKNKRQHKTEWAFLGFVAIAAIIVVSVIVNTNSSQDAPAATNINVTNNTNTSPVNEQSNKEANEKFSEDDEQILELFGFWIPGLQADPPNYTQTISDKTTTYDFGDGNAASVMPQESLSMVTGSLGNITEEKIVVDGYDAARLTGTSPKDGSQVSYIIIKNADSSFLLRGDDAFLTKAEKQMKIQNSDKK